MLTRLIHRTKRHLYAYNVKRRLSTVSNRGLILSDVDKALSIANKPGKGSIEYIFTKPAWRNFRLQALNKNSNSAQNPYGHSAIRYGVYDDRLVSPLNDGYKQVPTAKRMSDVVMNVSGSNGSQLVNFFDASDYFFTDRLGTGNQQGGVFNRSFVNIRISDVAQESITRMHDYYFDLIARQMAGDVKFTMVSHILTNRMIPLFHKAEHGNCAYWTGNGMVKAGAVESTSSWPLWLFFRCMFDQLHKDDGANMNIVAYRGINHMSEPTGSLMRPFYWFKHGYSHIWNLDEFANLHVEFYRKKELTGGTKWTHKIKQNPGARLHWHRAYQAMRRIIK